MYNILYDIVVSPVIVRHRWTKWTMCVVTITCSCRFNSIFCAIQTGIAFICIISSQVRSSLDKFSDKSGSIDTAVSTFGAFVDIRRAVLVAHRDRVLVRLLSVAFGSFLIRLAVAKK